ncbi:hypothetical protein ACFLSV_05200 [Bacteroidota bacterium]
MSYNRYHFFSFTYYNIPMALDSSFCWNDTRSGKDIDVRQNTQRFIPRAACHLTDVRSPGKEVNPCCDSIANITK